MCGSTDFTERTIITLRQNIAYTYTLQIYNFWQSMWHNKNMW